MAALRYFDELVPGKRYTLVHDEGPDGVVTTVFEGRTFDELFEAEVGQPVPARLDPQASQ